jgi:predicted nucleic acid-binding protein
VFRQQQRDGFALRLRAGEDRDEIEAALAHARNGIDFADALHLAASKSCSELLTFDDRGYARRAKKLRLKPPVRVPNR